VIDVVIDVVNLAMAMQSLMRKGAGRLPA